MVGGERREGRSCVFSCLEDLLAALFPGAINHSGKTPMPEETATAQQIPIHKLFDGGHKINRLVKHFIGGTEETTPNSGQKSAAANRARRKMGREPNSTRDHIQRVGGSY